MANGNDPAADLRLPSKSYDSAAAFARNDPVAEAREVAADQYTNRERARIAAASRPKNTRKESRTRSR